MGASGPDRVKFQGEIPTPIAIRMKYHCKRLGIPFLHLLRDAAIIHVRKLDEDEMRDAEIDAFRKGKKKGSVIPAVAAVPTVEYGDQRDVAAEAREQERAAKEAERKPSGTVTRVKVPLPEIPKVPTLMPRWEPTPAPKDDAPVVDTVDKEDEDESG
jgi:hypothetical protein